MPKRKYKAEEGIQRAAEGDAAPQKRFFRQRAHINPLNASDSYEYPITADRMDWHGHFPAVPELSSEDPLECSRYVEVADVGCGFGGLLIGLSPVLPTSLMVGMEIRPKVTEYVRLRILSMRREASEAAAAAAGAAAAEPGSAAGSSNAAGGAGTGASSAPAASAPGLELLSLPIAGAGGSGAAFAAAAARAGGGHNISVIKTNAMKLLPHFFFKGQLSKMFFCFPDPHFKKANLRRRIVTRELLDEYGYALREGSGRLYTITDVRDLHAWMVAACEAHPLFARIPEAELAGDPCVDVMRTATEEGQKVSRLGGAKFVAVYRRVSPAEAAARLEALTGGDFWTEPPIHYEHFRAKDRSEYHLAGSADMPGAEFVAAAAAAAAGAAAPASAVAPATSAQVKAAVGGTA